jgi:antitoxin ParD1/3/4
LVGILPTRALAYETESMTTVEKLSVALTPEMASLVRGAVEGGDYASTSEVIRDALRLWRDERAARALVVEELGQAWCEGIASGPGGCADMATIKAEARRRLAVPAQG